jgi:predicted O-linked N-acetylglucosamine transferase (SPINDLY family)
MRDTLEQLLQQAFAHFSAGRHAQAEGGYRKVLDRHPNNHEAIHMSAVIAHATGQTDRAAKLFARSIELAPDLAHYYQNAGKFFAEQDRHDAAITHLKRAIALNPADATQHANLANSLRHVGNLDEAESAARAGLAVDPRHPGCLAQLGNLLREMGRLPEAIDALKRSVAARPISNVHDTLLFLLYNDPTITPQDFLEHHRAYARLYTDPMAEHAKPHTGIDRNPDRKLRVAYVSADFRNHPVAAFMDAPLRHHDPKLFDVTCYSTNLQEDDVTRRIKKYPLRYVDARFDSFDQFVARIRKDRIDILVDLAGHTAHNRLVTFSVSPAPVQISYLGDPGTTGMRQVDYRLTDPVVDPPGQSESRYTETLLRLPGGFSCYTPDAKSHPDVSPLPALANGQVTFGSLHVLAKINDQVIDLWTRVLRAVPNSRLLMLRNTLTGSSLERYTAAFTSRGIDPARLDLRHQPLGGPTHLFTYRHIDCCLDCFPFSGHTTACEALFNGVPTLTLPTDAPHSRLVSSVLTMAGLTDFIAASPDHFVSLAQNLAADLPTLATRRAGLRQQMLASPLCDAPTFTRQLESAYRTAWRRYCATGS